MPHRRRWTKCVTPQPIYDNCGLRGICRCITRSAASALPQRRRCAAAALLPPRTSAAATQYMREHLCCHAPRTQQERTSALGTIVLLLEGVELLRHAEVANLRSWRTPKGRCAALPQHGGSGTPMK
eukprot:4579306-Pleurochrysis_carterae.AAC.1